MRGPPDRELVPVPTPLSQALGVGRQRMAGGEDPRRVTEAKRGGPAIRGGRGGGLQGCPAGPAAIKVRAAALMKTFGAELVGNQRTRPRTKLLQQLKKHRGPAAFRVEEERRTRLVAELQQARLTGFRFKVPAEVMSAKLADLPEGVSVERGRIVLPQVIVDAGPSAVARFLEFFAGRIANARTRAACGRAVGQFLGWCEVRGLGLRDVSPLHVAAYIRTHPGSAPTVKQHLAAIRMLGDWLVVSQVLPVNPAAAVRAPKHVVTKGATMRPLGLISGLPLTTPASSQRESRCP